MDLARHAGMKACTTSLKIMEQEFWLIDDNTLINNTLYTIKWTTQLLSLSVLTASLHFWFRVETNFVWLKSEYLILKYSKIIKNDMFRGKHTIYHIPNSNWTLVLSRGDLELFFETKRMPPFLFFIKKSIQKVPFISIRVFSFNLK